MSVQLGILTCASCSPTLLRHWEFFQRQKADYVRIVMTTAECAVPPDVPTCTIGDDRYIEGPHLPNRLLDTIEYFLNWNWWQLILAEYDTLFFRPIRAEKVITVAAHRAGSATWGSKANSFYHNPWVFSRDVAKLFLDTGRQAIRDGLCPDRDSGMPSTPECSPDVFFGAIVEMAHIPVHTDLWSEFSRNSLDIPGDLEQARAEYRAGIDVIHGVKTKTELDFILS